MPWRAIQIKPLIAEERRKYDLIVYMLLFAVVLAFSIISTF